VQIHSVIMIQRFYTYTRESLQQDFSADPAPNSAECPTSTVASSTSSTEASQPSTVQPSTISTRSSSHMNLGAIIGGTIGGASVLVMSTVIISLYRRRRCRLASDHTYQRSGETTDSGIMLQRGIHASISSLETIDSKDAAAVC
jgi:hypothetical protein